MSKILVSWVPEAEVFDPYTLRGMWFDNLEDAEAFATTLQELGMNAIASGGSSSVQGHPHDVWLAACIKNGLSDED